MNMVRWEPFGDLISLRQAMDRLLEDSFVKLARALAPFAKGVKEDKNRYIHLFQTFRTVGDKQIKELFHDHCRSTPDYMAIVIENTFQIFGSIYEICLLAEISKIYERG